MDYKNELNSDDDFDCSNSYNDGYGSSSNNNNNSRDNNSGYISNGNSRISNPNGLSKAELRKTNKPIMEKRRRARINHCLNELKTLILEAMKKDPARHTKLEKADILEMTVKHLQSLQRQQLNMAIQTDPSVVHKFKTGFVECAEEVNRYVSQLEGIDSATRQRLNNHLNNCATSLEQIGSMTNFNNSYRHGQLNSAASLLTSNPIAPATATTATVGLMPPLPQDLNNNSRLAAGGGGGVVGANGSGFPGAAIQMNGVQLIPSRLPSGELALIVPNPHTVSNATSLLNNNNNNNSNNNANNNNIGSFASWPPTHTVPATTATLNVPSLPLLDNAIALPTLNNFASQLQRMSAFTKPTAQVPPSLLTKFNNHTTTAKLPTPPPPVKPNFHTTTAAAFHQTMPQNSTTTTSPPLSPISSVSSLSAGGGDDSSSNMHTSSDLTPSRPTTPPSHDITNISLRTNTSSNQQHSFSGVFATPPLSAESSLSLSISSSGVSSLCSLSTSRGSKHLQQQQVTSTSGSESLNVSLKRPFELTDDLDSCDGSLDEPTSKRSSSGSNISLSCIKAEEKIQENSQVVNRETDTECKRQQHKISPEERDCMWRPW